MGNGNPLQSEQESALFGSPVVTRVRSQRSARRIPRRTPQATEDDVLAEGSKHATGRDQIVCLRSLDLAELHYLAALVLDGFDRRFEICIARNENCDIVAVLVGQRDHVDGQGYVDPLFDLGSAW